MMSEPVIILSADKITDENFISFLKKEGAFNPDDKVFPGRVSSGEKHIWIALNDQELSDLIEGRPDFTAAISKFLVRPPKAFIIVEISREPGSAKFAIDFAIKVMNRWHAVLFDYNERLLSLDDLRLMQKEGKEFDPVIFTPSE
jgi:hypothetical protein